MPEREQQLGGEHKGPRKTDVGLPQKDLESFAPRFSFTRDIVQHFQTAGITQEHYEPFARDFDDYLEQAATTENLVAIGVIAVPSTEGLAEYVIADGGFAMDAVAYWALPKKALNWRKPQELNPSAVKINADWDELGKDSPVVDTKFSYDRHFVAAANLEVLSQEDYPTLESVRATLEDEESRKKFTLSVGVMEDTCEFWGLVTTKQLKEELTL